MNDTINAPEGARPAGLTEEQREVLAQALADAITWREPSGVCPHCDLHAKRPAVFCDEHAPDQVRVQGYLALARDLGIDLPE
jgi:hypothetical protein